MHKITTVKSYPLNTHHNKLSNYELQTTFATAYRCLKECGWNLNVISNIIMIIFCCCLPCKDRWHISPICINPYVSTTHTHTPTHKVNFLITLFATYILLFQVIINLQISKQGLQLHHWHVKKNPWINASNTVNKSILTLCWKKLGSRYLSKRSSNFTLEVWNFTWKRHMYHQLKCENITQVVGSFNTFPTTHILLNYLQRK